MIKVKNHVIRVRGSKTKVLAEFALLIKNMTKIFTKQDIDTVFEAIDYADAKMKEREKAENEDEAND